MDKVVILARVSTDKQEYQRQVNELTDYCTRVGWSVEAVFSNKVSGAKRMEERPEIMDLIDFVKSNDIDKVVCLEISRLGRNTLQALKVLETLNPDGKVNSVASLICTILLEIASMERLTIAERMASGRDQYIAKCRREGVKMGRPATYRKSEDAYKQQYSREIGLLRKGISFRNIAAITGTSVNTLRKLKTLI